MTLFLAALALACGTATSSSTSTTTLTAAEGVALTVSGDGTYAVTVDGEAWLSSGPLGFTSGGVQYSSGSTAAPLKLSGSPKHSSGKDVLGAYEETLLQWVGGTTTMLTAFRAYTATPVLVFEQSFPEGFTTGPAPDCEGQEACKGAKITLSTAFPSWKMQGDAELSCFAGSSQSTNHGPWNGGHFGGGVSGGAPLVLFKQEGGKVAAASQQQQQQQRGAAGQSLRSVVMSPLDNFMATAFDSPSSNWGAAMSPQERRRGGGGGAGEAVSVSASGVLATVTHIPAGFTHPTVLVGGRGVNSALMDWGDVLLKSGGKTRTQMDHPTDRSLTHLGYWHAPAPRPPSLPPSLPPSPPLAPAGRLSWVQCVWLSE
jgi:hypothetical protein